MSIHINKNKCIGCKACTEVCPGNLIFMKDKSAQIRDVRDCWGCAACVKVCPQNAIGYYLPAELGGSGSEMFAFDDKNILTWLIKHSDGSEDKIIIDKNQSNRY